MLAFFLLLNYITLHCILWLFLFFSLVGVPHLESIQICSNMSRTNVQDFMKKLPDVARRKYETDLADLEAVFDLGYFQQDEGKYFDSVSVEVDY